VAYVRKPKVFKVSFEEPHFLAGLTLQTHAVSVREFAEFGIKLSDAARIEQAGTDAEKLRGLGALIDSLDQVRQMFAEKLISWDMEEEDGSPTPATLDGVMSLDDQEFYGIVGEWMTAVGGVDESLGKDSGSGGTSPELSALMEPLQPSQAS
jgi:hypothetical protein